MSQPTPTATRPHQLLRLRIHALGALSVVSFVAASPAAPDLPIGRWHLTMIAVGLVVTTLIPWGQKEKSMRLDELEAKAAGRPIYDATNEDDPAKFLSPVLWSQHALWAIAATATSGFILLVLSTPERFWALVTTHVESQLSVDGYNTGMLMIVAAIATTFPLAWLQDQLLERRAATCDRADVAEA